MTDTQTTTTTTTTTTPDAVIVRRLELLGGTWDGKRWVLPRDRLGDLEDLLADIDRPAMVKGGCIASACGPRAAKGRA
jgi:hypothetical protein